MNDLKFTFRPQSILFHGARSALSGLTLSSIKPQPDSEPQLSARLKQCLVEMAEKKDSEMLTPEFRENFSRSQRRHAALQNDMNGLKSFTFIMEEEPTADQREVDHVPVKRMRNYQVTTAGEARYYTIALTANDRVALVQASDD